MTNQMSSRIHVRSGSEIIRYSAESAPRGPTTNTAGVLNARGRFGSRTRSTTTPTETMTKASNVPIDTRVAASAIGRMAAKNATATPVTIDVMYGVWYRGCGFFTNAGNSPSRAMESHTSD